MAAGLRQPCARAHTAEGVSASNETSVCLLHDRYGQGTHLNELAVQVRQLFVIHGPHDRAFLNLSSSRGAYPHARHPVNGKRASVNSVE